MYHPGPFSYSGMQPQPGAQPPGPPGPRGQRQQYPQNIPPPSSRQPSSRVSVPAPRKRILAIVDPDTNEEVKVDNVDAKPVQKSSATVKAPSAPVKIPERTSRPLELVSDPADRTRAQDNVSKNVFEDKNTDVIPAAGTVQTHHSDFSETKQSQPVDTARSLQADRSTEPSVDVEEASSQGALPTSTSKPSETVTNPDPAVAKDTVQANGKSNSTKGDYSVSESEESFPPSPTVTEANKSDDVRFGKTPSTEVKRTNQPTKSAIVSAEFSEGSPTASLQSSSVIHSEIGTNDNNVGQIKPEQVKDANDAAQAAPGSPMLNAESKASRTSQALETRNNSSHDNTRTSSMNSDEVKDSNTTPAGGRDTFKMGGRRVYAPSLMLSMRSAANPKKAAEFELALSSNNIFKDGPASTNPRSGDPRGSRTVRPTGNTFDDPRGKRTVVASTRQYVAAPVRGSGPPGIMGSGGVGPYDIFDLQSARLQNPPPPPKGSQGIVRDPRGSRQVNPRDRFDGPMRHGPMDPFLNLPPVEKLKKTENGWKRNRESDDEIQAKVKQVRSLLNKLTLEKFEKIFKQIIDINISSYEVLTGVVKEVFEKALFEPKFSGMYAELCGRLDVATRDMLQKASIMDSSGKPIFFKNILLNNCKEEFTRFAIESEDANEAMESNEGGTDGAKQGSVTAMGDDGKPLTPEQQKEKVEKDREEAELLASKAKRRMLANMRFISELYLKGLLRESIIHRNCIQKLLAIGIEKKEEDVLEALCKLLSKTGAKLSENTDAIHHMDRYFQPLEMMAQDHTLPARVRFMLQDLIDQRANNWKLRREEVGAKTIAEIHKDIEKEERAKQEAQAASRERRGRTAGMHHRERSQQNYPRVPMTMAARQKPTGNGMSRSAAVIEKHGNRGPSTPPANFQTVRLGPGGSKLSSMTTGPTAAGRAGSRYGALAMVSETRDSSAVSQNDTRRAGPRRVSPGSRRPTFGKREQAEDKILEPGKLSRVVRNLLLEYWEGIVGITEARQYLETEVLSPNYPKFVEEAIKCSVDAKMDQREKSVSFFCGIIGGPIPAKLFVSAFSSVISQLPDIEPDNPRAVEFLAKYIGATAATKKLAGDSGSSFGLGFVKTAIGSIDDHKKGSKVVIHIFAELYKNLTAAIPEEERRQAAVKRALDELDIDLAAKMSLWNPINGVGALDRMLKDQGIFFILPIVGAELQLREVLSSRPSADNVCRVFTSSGLSAEDLHGEGFMKMVIRVSFDWLFMDPPSSIKEKFSSVIGIPLVQCLKPSIPPNVQMAALLSTQWFIVNNLQCLPPHKEGNIDKPGHIAFESLYEADIVEEEVFLRWREDTDKSTAIEGKDKMLMQTTHFFNWLETAEEEE